MNTVFVATCSSQPSVPGEVGVPRAERDDRVRAGRDQPFDRVRERGLPLAVRALVPRLRDTADPTA